MAWTNLVFSVGQILTAAQLTNLDDNFEALASGASGAPEIVRAALKSTTVSLAANFTAQAKVNITLTAYAFFPMLHGVDSVGGNNVTVLTHTTDGASADNPRFGLFDANTGTTSQNPNYDVDYRYIQA